MTTNFFQITVKSVEAVKLQEREDEIYFKIDGMEIRPRMPSDPKYWTFRRAGQVLNLEKSILWGPDPMECSFEVWEQGPIKDHSLGMVSFQLRSGLVELDFLKDTTPVATLPPMPTGMPGGMPGGMQMGVNIVPVEFHGRSARYLVKFSVQCYELQEAGCMIRLSVP